MEGLESTLGLGRTRARCSLDAGDNAGLVRGAERVAHRQSGRAQAVVDSGDMVKVVAKEGGAGLGRQGARPRARCTLRTACSGGDGRATSSRVVAAPPSAPPVSSCDRWRWRAKKHSSADQLADRKAIAAMESDLKASGGGSRDDSSGDGDAAKASSAQALSQSMSSLEGPIAETQGRYLDVLMDSCKSLPELVVSEIRTEVAGLLGKNQGQVGRAQQAAVAPAVVAAPIAVENPSSAELAGGLAHLMSLGRDRLGMRQAVSLRSAS